MALLKKVLEAGVDVIGNKRVLSYDFENPSVTVEGGETFHADIVVACDGKPIINSIYLSINVLHSSGVKSIARSQLLRPAIAPRDTGDIAYRILLNGNKMREDPELSSLITDPGATAWCGPDAHIVGYPIREGELYNMVICARRLKGECESDWIVPGEKSDLTRRFGDWEPRLQKMFGLVEDVSFFPTPL